MLLSQPLNRAETRARAIPRRPVTGIVLTGVWPCEPERATRGDLRRFLAGGLRALRDIAERKELEPEDRRRLFEVAFAVFSQAEELIWAQLEDSRRSGGEAARPDLIGLSEEEARVLREIGEEQEADLTGFREAVWSEDVHRPEGETATDLENYAL